jgi:hypothetical protein
MLSFVPLETSAHVTITLKIDLYPALGAARVAIPGKGYPSNCDVSTYTLGVHRG